MSDYGDNNGNDHGGNNNRDRSRSRDRDHDRDRDNDRDDHLNNEGGHDNGNGNGNGNNNNNNNNNEHQVVEGANLYVTRLSFETTDEDLRRAFSKYGDVSSVSIVKEPVTFHSRGFGFVAFHSLEDAEKAIEAMSGSVIHGRQIKVEKARRTTAYEKTPGRYLGPPQLSRRHEEFDRFSRRGPPPPPPGRFDRDYGREPVFDNRYERERDYRGVPPSRSPPRYAPPRDMGYGGNDRDIRGPPPFNNGGGFRGGRGGPPIDRRGPDSYPSADYRRYDIDERRGGPPPRDDSRRPDSDRRMGGGGGYDGRGDNFGGPPPQGYGRY